MRRAVIIAALATPFLAACGSNAAPAAAGSSTSASGVSCVWTSDGTTPSKPVKMPSATAAAKDRTATLATTVGTLTIHLTGTTEPCTVASFISLAEQKYYNGSTCHRGADQTGFAFLQCGAPLPGGNGGPGYTIPDELSNIAKETTAAPDGSSAVIYPAGTVAMANTGGPDTGGGQFFMVFGPSEFGPSYTVLGTMDPASIRILQGVGKAGFGPAGPAGGGAPKKTVTFNNVTIS